LQEGRDAIIEVPDSRWNQSAFHHSETTVPGTSYSRWAGLVEHAEDFDAAFFAITPREAQRLDPQQRWFLEATWRALEDSGHRIEDLRKKAVGVYVGCSSSDYGEIQRRWRYNADLHTNSGAAVSLLANRVSYTFDFRGPSLVVDTACSSSLVALDLAARAIRDGQCEAAIVGGANALFMPDATIGFSKASMLARDGRCKAFDARADGYVRAEGAVALFIKPLDRAVAEGDRIYACILSTVTNQDGQTPSLTVPSESQQRAMIEAAYDKVVDQTWVGGVEAHGTGTPVGDPIEANALGQTLGRSRSPEHALWISSIKTNIGHLEPASGAAGMAKLALSLYHRKVAASLHFQNGNPAIDFIGLGLRVPTATEDWPVAPDGRCYGGINSFGFGGTNAHAVLSSPPSQREEAVPPSGPILWPLSARNGAALRAAAEQTQTFLQELDETDVRRRSVVQCRRSSSHSHRVALVANDRNELVSLLKSVDVSSIGSRPQFSGRRLFVFSGQGSQWHGMARDLADVGEAAAAIGLRVSRLMPPVAGRNVLDALRDPDPAHINRTDVVQPLLFLQQLMLAAQLEAWGVAADAVCGHSVGEVTAAYWAGALTLEDAVTIVFHRSRLQEITRGSGAMAAVGLPVEQIEEKIASYSDLHVAAVNSPASVTIAGNSSELQKLLLELKEFDTFVHQLEMPYAFHSPHMDVIRDDLLSALREIAPRQGRLPFFSTVTGTEELAETLNAEYWWQNLRQPVRFETAIKASVNAQCHLAIELGPHPSLLRVAADSATDTGNSLDTLATLQRGLTARRALSETLAKAWQHGLEPNWSAVYPGICSYQRLPGHPWQRQRHWLESTAVRAYRMNPFEHPLLGRKVYGARARWETLIDLERLSDFADHRIHGDAVMPAAAFVEQMLAVGRALFGDAPVAITHLDIDRMLVLDRPRLVHVEYFDTGGRVEIYSEPDGGDEAWSKHIQGHILSSSGALQAPLLPAAECGRAVETDELYRRLDAGGNHYGPRFRCLRELFTDGQQAWGRIALDPASINDAACYRFHPALLDAAFHMVLELLGTQRSELYLPVGVDRIEFVGQVGSAARCLVRNATRNEGSLRADIYVYDESGVPLAVLEGCHCRAIEVGSSAKSSAQAFEWAWEPAEAQPSTFDHHSFWLWGFDEADTHALQTRFGIDCIHSSGSDGLIEGDLICWFRGIGGRPIEAARNAVLALAQLVQRHSGHNTRVHLVTEGATCGHAAATDVRADLAAVWALGRSLLTESPVAMSGMTDLEIDTELSSALMQIGADVGACVQETAWRDGCRFEHRLKTVLFDHLSERTVRSHDVAGFTLSVGRQAGFGSLHFRSQPPPVPGPGQLTLAVEASGINFRDILKVLDVYPLDQQEWRWLGDECSGQVVAIGAGVNDFSVGDDVIAIAPASIGTHTVADARLVARRPISLPSEMAAGVPIAFLTAWYSLVECGRVAQGETVLIHAAAGGVGQAAIQIARLRGAHVLATASSEKQGIVAALGAEAVFDSRDLSFPEAVRNATGGRGVDIVLNSLAGEALLHSIDLLKPFGRFLEIGKRDIFANRLIGLRSLRDNRAFFSIDLTSWLVKSPTVAGQRLTEIVRMLENGILQAIQTHVTPIRSAPEAFRQMAQGKHVGKLVLRNDTSSAPSRVVHRGLRLIREDASYLITGGTSGLGLLVAQWFAKMGAKYLVLVSRTGRVAKNDRDALEIIRQHGAYVHLRACDVSNFDEVKNMLAEIRRDLPPLRGIVHGAMVLDDVDVLNLDEERLNRVLRPKSLGAWNLSDLSESDPLDFFLMHGSMAAFLGAAGQSNYVVANHLLEVLAANRRLRGLPAQTIAWGPIAEAGIVARSPRLQSYFERAGLIQLDRDTIETTLQRVLNSDEIALAVGKIDWTRLERSMAGLRSDRRYSHLLELVGEGSGDEDFVTVLRAADPSRRRQLLVRMIAAAAASVLSIPLVEVPHDRPLNDIGLDSLMALELSVVLESKLKRRLPIASLQGHRSITELAEKLGQLFASPVAIDAEQQKALEVNGKSADGKAADLSLRFLGPGALIDPQVRFDAAALTYIPEEMVRRGGLDAADIQRAFGSEPFLSGVIDAPIGRVGAFMLPVRGRELFSKPDRTVALVQRSLELASSLGSRVMTLTGLLPAATGYGDALQLVNGHYSSQKVTTGHALTTATLVTNLVDLLERCGRRIEQEEIAIVGLGSVGRSVLELLLRKLAHPRRLVLCDLYAKIGATARIRQRIQDELHFSRPIELVAGDDGLPDQVLSTKLIVSAVDRAGLVDPGRLGSGTILLDDSYPPTFDPEMAWRRMDEQQDVVIASGGFARLPAAIHETFYVPDSARPFVQAYGEERFLQFFQRDPCNYTACVFAGPLALQDPDLRPQTGIPTPEALVAFYDSLQRHQIMSATPHCHLRPIPDTLFAAVKANGCLSAA
jgi:acyl transferase domain-containing protein/NAD(P)-dependent dehydrogenase (short-subunit alcohol dehydrogenase family)/acyl carrier protein